MTAPIGKALGEGNCGRATDCGKEACEPSIGVAAGSVHAKTARLRTETSYKAGSARRVSQSSRSRSQNAVQVNDELAQGKFTLLSGEICIGGMRVVVAPASKACLNAWNGLAKANSGGAEVSRGRITEDRTPTITGRTER